MLRKKLLSLGLAGAMVAGVAMPASAQTITGDDTKTLDANVTVSGTVTKSDGTAVAGKLQVEVPTSLTFAVDKAGNFDAPTFTITNQSSSAIDVSVGSFRETIASGGITVQPKVTALNDKDRSNVHLRLMGDQEIDLGGAINPDEVLSTISAGNSSQIQVLGAAGQKVIDASDSSAPDVDKNGAAEDFNLVFKIKKA